MPETNSVECYLCGKEGPSQEMSIAVTPILGHHADPAMAAKWFCPDPCFEDYRKNPHLRARVHQWQDACCRWAKATVSGIDPEALKTMEALPEGLKITPSERERWTELRDKLDRVEEVQSFEDNHLLHKICRNINKNPFYHHRTGTFKDYESLREDFIKLETLPPEERRKLS